MKTLFATLLVCLLFTSLIRAQDKAPVISLKDLKGKKIRLNDFKGKIVLINFWATWCVPCAAEVPELIKWQDQYRKDGLQIVGITYPPTNVTRVRRFVKKNKIPYPILFGSKATKKLFEPSETLPITVILDKEGKIIDRIDGVIFADEFETKIKSLLRSPR